MYVSSINNIEEEKMKIKYPKIDTNIVVIISTVIIIFLALYYVGDSVGLEADSFTDFLLIMPGLFFFALGILIIGRMGGLFALPGFTIVGIGMAVLFEEMYDLGIVNDSMISNLAIGEFQMLVIAVAFLVGAVVTGVTAKR